MRCPVHPALWLYENMIETEGFCPLCQTWFDLQTGKEVTWDLTGKIEVAQK